VAPLFDLRWKLADDNPQGALFDEGVTRHQGKGEFRGMEFIHVNAKTIINEVPAASRVPFRYTINAYRGCQHACAYCFARPTHEYLGMNSGDDFDSKIVVKVNAVDRVRAEVRRPTWGREHIAMGTNTDPYQRCEGKYRLTRGIVEVLAAARNPFSILTKSTLILRDLDVLAEAAKHIDVRANFSIGTLDTDVWRMTEPGTPHPLRRVEAVAKLNQAGVRCGVLLAPVLPGLSDRPEQLETVVKACVEAGATSITPILLHLRPGVRDQYLGWLETARPDLLEQYKRVYPKSYAPRRTQDELSVLVRRLVTRHGGRVVGPRPARDVRTPKGPLSTEPQQLDMNL
jgi:DNA repair photolyase